jgi:hypothetical protein
LKRRVRAPDEQNAPRIDNDCTYADNRARRRIT